MSIKIQMEKNIIITKKKFSKIIMYLKIQTKCNITMIVRIKKYKILKVKN
jgi:hypothetical protein